MTFEFDDAFDEFEDDIQAVVDHIRLLNNDNKIDEVISYILSLPDSVRNNNVVLGCLSSSYLIKGEYEKAEKALLQIDMNDPDFNKGGIYSYTLASIKAGEGKYAEALREGKRALMQNPTSEGLIERIFSLIADISEKLVEAGKKGLPFHKKYAYENIDYIREELYDYFGLDKSDRRHHFMFVHGIDDVELHFVENESRYGVNYMFTVGLSKYAVDTSTFIRKAGFERIELMLEIPSEWNSKTKNRKASALFKEMKTLIEVFVHLVARRRMLFWSSYFSDIGMFTNPDLFQGACAVFPVEMFECTTLEGDDVNLYQLYALRKEDVDFIKDHSIQTFIAEVNKLEDLVIDGRDHYFDISSNIAPPERPQVLEWNEIDNVKVHLNLLERENLPPESTYTHMAIYLRWMDEHDLVAEGFKEVMTKYGNDYVKYMKEEQNGVLPYWIFTKRGADFSEYFYEFYKIGYTYPYLLVCYTEEYFGKDKEDKTYLDIPYSEDYYAWMSDKIDVAWKKFKEFEERVEGFKPIDIPERNKDAYINEEILLNDGNITFAYKEKPVDAADSGWRFNNEDKELDKAHAVSIRISDAMEMNRDLDRILNAKEGKAFFARKRKFSPFSWPGKSTEPEFGFPTEEVEVDDVHRMMLSDESLVFFQKRSSLVLDGTLGRKPYDELAVSKMIAKAKKEALYDGFDWDEDIVGEIEGEEDHTMQAEIFPPLLMAKTEGNTTILDYVSPVKDENGYSKLYNTSTYLSRKFGLVGKIALYDRLIFVETRRLTEPEALEAATVIYAYAPEKRKDTIGEIASRLLKCHVASIIV